MDAWILGNIVETYKYLGIIAIFLFLFLSGNIKINSADVNIENIEDSFNIENIFSLQSVLAFFVGFGWIGYAMLKLLKAPFALAVIASVLVGAGVMVAYAYAVSKLQYKNKINQQQISVLLNKEGKAKNTIYPRSEGHIEITIDGQEVSKKVINSSDVEINDAELVKIVKIENNTLFVEKV